MAEAGIQCREQRVQTASSVPFAQGIRRFCAGIVPRAEESMSGGVVRIETQRGIKREFFNERARKNVQRGKL